MLSDPREFMGASQNRFLYSRVRLLSVRPEIQKTLSSVSPLKRENEWFTEITGTVLLPAGTRKKKKNSLWPHLTVWPGALGSHKVWNNEKFWAHRRNPFFSDLNYLSLVWRNSIQPQRPRTQMGHCNWWRVWTETKAEGSSLSRWGAELGCRSD